jgi:hypothetical protein
LEVEQMTIEWPAVDKPAGMRESASGITLLEAYSALAKRNGATAAIEIPFPGHPSGVDPEGDFWGVRIQKVG